MMFAGLVLCLLGFAYAQAATTMPTTHHGHHHTGPHPSHEPNEHETFKFAYEPHTHMMVLLNNKDCYVFNLSDAERTAVHTSSGLRSLELKLVNLLDSGTLTPTTKESLDKRLSHACTGHATNFYNIA